MLKTYPSHISLDADLNITGIPHHILAEKQHVVARDMVVLPHNIRPGRITLYTTSLYVLEQCSMFKIYATLSLEGTIYIRPRYPNIFD